MSESVAASTLSVPPAEGEAGTGAPEARRTGDKRRGMPWGATWVLLLSLSAIASAILVMTLHANRGFFVPALAIGVCGLAALFDAWTTRIPNALTYTTVIVGLLINLASTGLLALHADTAARCLGAPGATQSLLGFAICATVGILGALARIGGGDIKLLVALGALLGLADIGAALVVALTIASIYALLNLAVFGRLNLFMQLTAMKALEFFYVRRLDLPPTVDAEKEPGKLNVRNSVPMAIPLVIGLVIAQVLNVRAFLQGAG